MRVTLNICIYAILATAPIIPVVAQTTPPEASTSKPAGTKEKAAPPARKAPDPNAAARRSLGLSLLKSLADEARGYRDETLRARVQARVADAIWGAEPETA